MRYKIKGKEIDDYAKNINFLINDQFEHIVFDVKDIVRDSEWTGPAKESFSNKYDSIIKELDKIPYTISLYTGFLGNTLEDFSDAVEDSKKRFREFDNQFEKKESNYE